MADEARDSPASGGSQCPSPEIFSDIASSNASPISAPPSLYMARTSDEGESSEHRSPGDAAPAHPASDVTRSHSASSKGGCWTCRLRRKKCDEEREGDSCKTCRRLKLECLGWGAKRPDWMRDKEKVAVYKASIKEQLSRAGLIRGQPKPAYIQPNMVSHHTPGVAGPGPSSMRRNYSAGEADIARRRGYGASPPYHQPSAIMPIPGSVGARRSPTDLRSVYGMHMNSFPAIDDPARSQTMSYHSPTIPVSANNEALVSYNSYFPASGSSADPQCVPVATEPSISHDSYLVYYFDHVRKVQYVFAGNSLANMLYSIVASDPRGPVANAIYALSSMYYTRMQLAQGFKTLEPSPEQSEDFYDQARYQLMNNKTLNGLYSESDAIAAVQLISYSCLSGGQKDWVPQLDVGCDWLAQTRIHEEQNPKLTLLAMNHASRFAAKAIMGADIFSSVTFMQPPRFLSLYRRLFGGGAGGFWASTQQAPDLRMDTLTGCPDEAMLAIAETSALAHWKAVEMQNGSLSMRELIRRGDEIEQRLRAHQTIPTQFAEGTQTPLDPSLSAASLGMSMASGIPSPASSSGMGRPAGAVSKEDARRLIAGIFCETAVLYLHTVLSESLPAVPEISAAVSAISQLLTQLPPSDFDRAILFPLYLTGCMTDDLMLRDIVKRRFLGLGDTFGNISQARTLMEHIWSTRDSMHIHQRGVVDWREALRNWANLLLI
ncbi:hypothetical protein AcW1_007949 [Taiwanofungus camphoratus]|nr:hypothetical protein AcW1_007949 [Antrodia cinnamomea]